MIAVRVPLRICLAGGGSDLPAHYRREAGYVLSATIDKYLTINVRPGDRLRLEPPDPYVIAAGWTDCDFVTVDTEVLPGSGLGGSGAYMVGLLKTRWPELERYELASAAYNIERYTIGKPVGWQDAVVAAFGGLVEFKIDTDGEIAVWPRTVAELSRLHLRLALFATNMWRDASNVLSAQANAIVNEQAARDAMDEIVRVGKEMAADLIATGGQAYGRLMDQHWKAKKIANPSATSTTIDSWYKIGLDNGAEGGKLIGAGGAGYMVFYVQPRDRDRLVAALTTAGLEYKPFTFVDDRATVL